ncbi:hypothetical protein UFOVP995_41 [uncultured Caudovirales phage]|uniref:Uncharacterized protein n=1 Tax=uncultured Caudovirales phage TaxID=2100421 RepID=A0A6J5PZQ1_9CAUD|nr:hypothetical protein UFOVP995_41 [uncultured Caudovirales phage]
MKAPNPFKVVRCYYEKREWFITYDGREVARIATDIEDTPRGKWVQGYWVTIEADGTDCYIDTDGGSTETRLAFRNAKEFAFEHLAKLLAEGVEL